MSTSLLQNEIAWQADSIQKLFREMRTSIQALARQLASPKPQQHQMFPLVESIKRSGKNAQELISELEGLPAKTRVEQDKKSRIVSQLSTQLESLLAQFQEHVAKVQEFGRNEVEVIKASFTEETRRSFIEAAAMIDTSSKASFAESIASSDLEVLSIDETVLLERQAELEQIAACMHDVKEMMNDCAVLVDEQGDNLDRIENSVESTVTHTDKAAMELVKAESYQQSSQKKMWILFVMLLLTIAVTALGVVVFFK